MLPNAFIGKPKQPTDKELGEALGSTRPLWDQLLAFVAEEHGVATLEWKCYSIKFGWSLRLLRGKRTILWLAPHAGCFTVMFILGDKAVRAARQSGLSSRTLRALDEAPKYPEGTGLRLLIKGPRDIPAIKKLTAIKIAN